MSDPGCIIKIESIRFVDELNREESSLTLQFLTSDKGCKTPKTAKGTLAAGEE